MKNILLFFLNFVILNSFGKDLPSSIIMKDISAGTFTMGSNSLSGSPTQQTAAPEHEVTLSP